MFKFFITPEERRRAQDRAAELDIGRSNPPGQYPYVWDNRQNSVKRWYDYGSKDEKLGTVYFELVSEPQTRARAMVRCTTEITQHSLRAEGEPRRVKVVDIEAHRRLAESIFHELLARSPRSDRYSSPS